MAAVAGAVIAVGSSLLSAYGQKKAGDAAEEQALLNAGMLLSTAYNNVALGMEAAEWNAGSALRIGEANASAIETVYNQNAVLMGVEGAESIRRHVIEEKQMLGTVRAMQGGSGSQVNTDTNLHFFLDQAYEAEFSRQYQGNKTKTSILNYMGEQQLRADLTRMDAGERASAIMFNATIESQVAMNEANMQAMAMEAGGALQAGVGRINAYASLATGLGSAYSGFISATR